MLLVHDPVVEVVVEVAVALLEVQFLEHGWVFHQVQAVVDIALGLLGQDEGVVDELVEGHRSGEVQEGVAGLNKSKRT